MAAIHNHNPPNSLSDLRNWAMLLSNIDSGNFLSPLPYGSSLLDDCQDRAAPATAGIQIHHGLFQPVVAPATAPLLPNLTLFNQPDADTTPHVKGARKRRKVSRERRSPHELGQQHTPLPLVDLNKSLGCSAVSAQLSVPANDLRLEFEDELSTITSSRPDVQFGARSALCNVLNAELSRQGEELDQFLTSQADQLRQLLEERRRSHSQALISSIEEGISQRLREKELELKRVNGRNLVLEERVKQLRVESHMWQSKAKSNEAMAVVLWANLQQAMVQGTAREESKEGCGESEEGDAASACNHLQDEDGSEKINGSKHVLVRVCKLCRVKEASILLLPCLHLCVCKDCMGEVESCPSCHSVKSASVEVYLS